MYRVLGLLNFEEKYQDTPHNIGGEILKKIYDRNSLDFSALKKDKTRQAEITEGVLEDCFFEFVFPTSFMNNSGNSLKTLKLDEEEKKRVIVIHDDIDLPFGKIKISFGRGSGGHNGVSDIINKLGTKNFVRIRIGVCPKDFFGKPRKPKGREAVNRYLVSKKLSGKYLKQYDNLAEKTEKILKSFCKEGVEKTMSLFNAD